MQNQNVYVFDIETIFNCFTYTAINKDTKEWYQFVIWKHKSELVEFINHLKKVRGMVGFNNLNFDYPVLHYIIKNASFIHAQSPEEQANLIYKEAQRIINLEYSVIKEDEVLLPQLDLFRIWHYDNKARMTSLKKLEIAMEFPNVQDMPIHHTQSITEESELKDVLSYNKNDVEATLDFYFKTQDKIELRKGLLKQYGLKCLNYSDSKIGEQLMLKLYCEATGKDEGVVNKQRTKRKVFKFKDCIPDYISYNTTEFNGLLDYLKGIEVDTLKESFSYTFDYKGFGFDLGTGGIHGCIEAGVYESDNEEVIIDCDVASLYPSLAITLGLYPKHLGEEFPIIYENNLLKPRIEAKKRGDKVMDLGYKLSLNSVYGKSNSEYSWLYDPLYTIKTTLAGQLALCMLSEMLMTQIGGLTMLQINTDGLTVKIPVKAKRQYWEICKQWESLTGLMLEYVAYSEMIIRDVNNYIAVSQKDGKVKRKGTFKTNEEMRKDGEYHKSFSQGIVSVALSDFYLKNIPVEETIKNCRNIYEFCKTGNTTGQWWAETFNPETNEAIDKQQKNNRYFLSTNGVGFRKCTYKLDKETNEPKFTSTEYEAGKLVTIFNKFEEKPFNEYNVDYDYYIEECYKIIHKLDGTEKRLEEERKARMLQLKLEREENNFLKYCVNKKGTKKQIETYSRDWLIEKYGTPEER